ncbi:MAG: hypothetical protein ACRCX5_14535 [Bacteroidales bacterium]
MRKRALKYYNQLYGTKVSCNKASEDDKSITKKDYQLLLYKMYKQEQLLNKIDKQSSFGLGVLQNVTGDAIFEVVLRGASLLFKR